MDKLEVLIRGKVARHRADINMLEADFEAAQDDTAYKEYLIWYLENEHHHGWKAQWGSRQTYRMFLIKKEQARIAEQMLSSGGGESCR
jgi:hypothetical protein